MQVIDLFSGLGAFSYAAHQIPGWRTGLFCEIDRYCQELLKLRFPGVPVHDDIKTLNYDAIKKYGWNPTGRTVLCGGFPCESFSIAGKRGNDLSLWCEMLRVCREIRPDYVVAENIYGIVNIDGGNTLQSISDDLENSGYERPIILDISADCFGLQTMERHIWIISKAISIGQQRRETKQNKNNGNEREFQRADQGEFNRRDISTTEFCRVDKRVSKRLDKHGRERLKQLGRAITWLVAFEIFRSIKYGEQT